MTTIPNMTLPEPHTEPRTEARRTALYAFLRSQGWSESEAQTVAGWAMEFEPLSSVREAEAAQGAAPVSRGN